MSTSSGSTSQRPYPLSPPPHIETKPAQEVIFQQPQTPQSPLQPASNSPSKLSPTEPFRHSFDNPLLATAHLSTSTDNLVSNTYKSTTMEDVQQNLSVEGEELSNKRKRDVEDNGDQEQKKVHVEDRRLGIEELHLNVGKKYLLCRTPHPRIQPSLSQDLFSLYSLNDIASQVARTLPNGEKNKLRKTYKGKIKDLGIGGKFDVAARDDDAPDGFLAMLRQPEVEWSIQNRMGKEIENGLGAAIQSSLDPALTMSKGLIPKSSWDSSVLGELDLPDLKVPTAAALTKPVATGIAQKGVSPAAGQLRNGKLEAARPKRNVKKRGYEESSFEGYGEGYVDDDMVDGGYSTAEGDDRGISQKRRKKSATSHNYPGPMRHNSYGPGMVGA